MDNTHALMVVVASGFPVFKPSAVYPQQVSSKRVVAQVLDGSKRRYPH